MIENITNQPLGSLPPDARERLDAMGPRWAEDINGHRDAVVRAYTPLVQRADNGGIAVARDLAYGPAPRQVLDVHARPEWRGGSRDVLVFFHGGAFVRGNKSANGAIYDNVAAWFARQGCVAINAEYRLAPDTTYPGGAEDVIAVVHWVRAHVATYGGNPQRVFLMGHSAGGAHVASAVCDPGVPGHLGAADVAGAMLVSARLWADVWPDNPNAHGVRAYFGDDPAAHGPRSPGEHIAHARVPLFVAAAEFENPHLDTYATRFHTEAVRLGLSRPEHLLRLPRHNHTSIVAHFNSGEETLGSHLLRFMREAGPLSQPSTTPP